MCSSCRNNQNPQTVKLSTRSSGCPYWPDMQTVKRRCAQTAHISLHKYTTSKSADTKHAAHPNFGRICRLASRISAQRFIATSATAEPAFPRLVCFGEPLFRPRCPNPQEEKTPYATISCQAQGLQGFSGCCGRKSAQPRLGKPAKPLPRPPAQANPCPRWVICPPQMVSAIPVLARSPTEVASTSPSSNTRSAASPGTSLPVSASTCAAQAPPAV